MTELELEEVTHWNRASHFDLEDYRFGMTDVVNGYVVSTCGDYRPPSVGGRRVDVSYGRAFETKVFRDTGSRCHSPNCVCGGAPTGIIGTQEVDLEGYPTEEDARTGHARMVKKYGAASGDCLCGIARVRCEYHRP
jgi:hypothetical protein